MTRAAGEDGHGARRDAEAARLLRRLAQGDAVLAKEDGSLRLTWRGKDAVQSHRVAPGLIRFCLVQDWCRLTGNRLAVSDAGRAWLRRLAAGDEPYRRQHQIRKTIEVEIGGARRPAMVNEAESPLGWLKNRKDRSGRPLISETQYEAGERLRSDYNFAQLTPRTTANWDALAPTATRGRRGPPSDAAALRDEVLAAKERVAKALEAAGVELAGVLVDVCCELKGLEEAEKSNGWPQRAGKVVLQIALSRLARHYGLIPEQQRKAGQLRHWGVEDYRPSLARWAGEEG